MFEALSVVFRIPGLKAASPNLELRQLRYFTKIVEAKSFGKAALSLGLAQPALSQQIRKLEEELGVLLLVRHSSGVVPTEPGEVLFGHAQSILAHIERAAHETRDRGDAISGKVDLGMPAPLCVAFGPRVLREVREFFPQIDLRLVEGRSVHLEDQLIEGSLDLAVLYEPSSTKLLLHERLAVEELVLIGPHSDTALPARLLHLEALASFPLILPTTVRGFVESAMQHRGVGPQSVIELNSHPTMMRLVTECFGYGLLPELSIIDGVRAGRFRICRLPQPEMSHRVVLSSATERPLSRAAREIARHLRPLLIDCYRTSGLQGSSANQALPISETAL
ncbi:LysR family transcriptional regulator [Microvirga antarctica]|uniref:LysR family transcriptional regulator n=1 Tax=Microvirga antarctica TaxID=2819233 RepID=UPI001B30D74F|nr:LysR substrate-binding domain-containing protein [Microvirga antarctica]